MEIRTYGSIHELFLAFAHLGHFLPLRGPTTGLSGHTPPGKKNFSGEKFSELPGIKPESAVHVPMPSTNYKTHVLGCFSYYGSVIFCGGVNTLNLHMLGLPLVCL